MHCLLSGRESIDIHTDLTDVFKAINNIQLEYNWLLTDLECNHYPDNRLCSHAVFMSGEELTKIVKSTPIQFIWGVLSGFPKNIEIDTSNLTVYPCADNNRDLWKPEVNIQYPGAEIEIICWDSTLTLLLAKDRRVEVMYLDYYEEAIDLEEYNRR